jgi:hypothetical protein
MTPSDLVTTATHGALKALIIANEFLERDFEKLLARECSRNSG